ncbi:MAG: hypothetical protein KDD64_00260 [Bdellovibrionales bacterium]|nr:hypothetical protein [Bdellovibrionales bacterium]
MLEPQQSATVVKNLLRPMIRFALRQGLRWSVLQETVRELLVEAAVETSTAEGKKSVVSKISLITGIDRRDVKRLIRTENELDRFDPGVLSKVLLRWRVEDQYITRSGSPRVLTYLTADNSFERLVREVSTDFHPGTVLSELERLEMVEYDDGKVRLKRRFASVRQDVLAGFATVSNDIEGLLEGSAENILSEQEVSNAHLRTYFDNIYRESIPAVKRLIIKEVKRFHARLAKELARFDKDLSVARGKSLKDEAGVKVMVTSFSHVNPSSPPSEKSSA